VNSSPSKESGHVPSPQEPLPAPALPLVELAALQSFISDRCSGHVGLPAPTKPPRFRRTSWYFTARRPPLLSQWVHPLVSFASPSEFSSPYPPGTSRRRAPSMGFRPPSRHQLTESTHASIPSPLRSVLEVSHLLDGLLLLQPCGFISPRSHVRDSPFRVFPSCAAAPSRRWPVPSGRFTTRPAPACARAPDERPRLQGFVPRRSPSRCARG